MIIVGMICMVLILLACAALYITDDESIRATLIVVCIFLTVVGFVAISEEKSGKTGYKQGQIDALNGQFEYEKNYVYRANDSVLVDSTYTLIN